MLLSYVIITFLCVLKLQKSEFYLPEVGSFECYGKTQHKISHYIYGKLLIYVAALNPTFTASGTGEDWLRLYYEKPIKKLIISFKSVSFRRSPGFVNIKLKLYQLQ